MRVGQTLMFCGVWFWSGVALFLVSLYGLLTWQPTPGSAVFGPVIGGNLQRYGLIGLMALSVCYVLMGWSKARSFSRDQ